MVLRPFASFGMAKNLTRGGRYPALDGIWMWCCLQIQHQCAGSGDTQEQSKIKESPSWASVRSVAKQTECINAISRVDMVMPNAPSHFSLTLDCDMLQDGQGVVTPSHVERALYDMYPESLDRVRGLIFVHRHHAFSLTRPIPDHLLQTCMLRALRTVAGSTQQQQGHGAGGGHRGGEEAVSRCLQSAHP